MDRRVVKTKRAIRNAFAEMLSKKDVNDITIKDVVDVADINRKTFYNYYDGIYSIIDEIENEMTVKFDNELRGTNFLSIVNNPNILFTKLVSLMKQDYDFYEKLFLTKNYSNLDIKLITILKNKVINYYAEEFTNVNKTELSVVSDFICTGIIKAYHTWFNSDKQISLEEISRTITEMCCNGINGLLKIK